MATANRILLSVTGFEPSAWRDALARHAPDREVVTDIDAPDDPSIRYAIVWKQRPGILQGLPNLQAIFSIGAGVDHILAEGNLPEVPIVRAVADDLTDRMSEYVVWQVLDHLRKGPMYRRQQQDKHWHEALHQPAAKDVTVGIMGLGVLGKDAASKLKVMGFNVAGWSRTHKRIDGIDTHAGDEGLAAFLEVSDVIVCLLPLTPQTKGILSADLFSKLKKKGPFGAPVLINAGRGRLQVEPDILAALDSGQLSAASLDVFQAEPLPKSSPLWSHAKVTITPHAAATSDPDALIPPMIRQMEAMERGEPLNNLVDCDAGY